MMPPHPPRGPSQLFSEGYVPTHSFSTLHDDVAATSLRRVQRRRVTAEIGMTMTRGRARPTCPLSPGNSPEPTLVQQPPVRDCPQSNGRLSAVTQPFYLAEMTCSSPPHRLSVTESSAMQSSTTASTNAGATDQPVADAIDSTDSPTHGHTTSTLTLAELRDELTQMRSKAKRLDEGAKKLRAQLAEKRARQLRLKFPHWDPH